MNTQTHSNLVLPGSESDWGCLTYILSDTYTGKEEMKSASLYISYVPLSACSFTLTHAHRQSEKLTMISWFEYCYATDETGSVRGWLHVLTLRSFGIFCLTATAYWRSSSDPVLQSTAGPHNILGQMTNEATLVGLCHPQAFSGTKSWQGHSKERHPEVILKSDGALQNSVHNFTVYVAAGGLFLSWSDPYTQYEDAQNESSPKVMPLHLDCTLVAGSSNAFKTLLHYFEDWWAPK